MADHPEYVSIVKGISSASIHVFGATLTSWKPFNKEAIFVSKNSLFNCKDPIRGGVPVIFPQFGAWHCGPQHGFARRQCWSTKTIKKDSVTFVLADSEESRKIWDYKFLFEYTISLLSESELKMHACIKNTGDESSKPFDFTFLLHTYFSVPDVKACVISGLNGCSYIDKVKGGELSKEERENFAVSEFTDRIYQNTPSKIKVTNTSASPEVCVEKNNLPDAVVWNPGKENAIKMKDFGDDEWEKMICIEAGHVSNPYSLKPGESYEGYQILSVKQ